ncbi:MAG TPA: hypothetical protein VI215_08525 [Bacteroidota bacterium]|jgi:hypothetical protein
MIAEHWFWWLLTMACVAWYSTITIYVAVKGLKDIRGMLRRLSVKNEERTPNGASEGNFQP